MPGTKTHRLVIEGSIPTVADIDEQSSLYEAIKPAMTALREIVVKHGGTLICTPQRVGTKKTVPAVPASQSAPGADKELPPPPEPESVPHPLSTAPRHKAA